MVVTINHMPKIKMISKWSGLFEICNLILITHIEDPVGNILILLHCQPSISSNYLHEIIWIFHVEYTIWHTFHCASQ